MGTSTSLHRMSPGLGLRIFGSHTPIGFNAGDGGAGGGGGTDDGGKNDDGADDGKTGKAEDGKDGGSDGGSGADGGQGGTGGSGGGSGKKDDGDGGKAQATKVEDLDPLAQKLIREARDDAAKNRTAKTAAEKARADLIDTVAKALGLKEDEQPTAEQLAAELGKAHSSTRGAVVELAVFRRAGKHGADPDKLTDSRDFEKKLAQLDPTADDFQSRLDDLIKDAVEENPERYKAGEPGAPKQTGGDFGGGTGDRPAAAENDVDAQREARRKARGLRSTP